MLAQKYWFWAAADDLCGPDACCWVVLCCFVSLWRDSGAITKWFKAGNSPLKKTLIPNAHRTPLCDTDNPGPPLLPSAGCFFWGEGSGRGYRWGVIFWLQRGHHWCAVHFFDVSCHGGDKETPPTATLGSVEDQRPRRDSDEWCTSTLAEFSPNKGICRMSRHSKKIVGHFTVLLDPPVEKIDLILSLLANKFLFGLCFFVFVFLCGNCFSNASFSRACRH